MVYLVCMDAKYKVLGCHKLGEGTVNAADITPRRVVEQPWPTTPPPSSWPTTTSQAWPSPPTPTCSPPKRSPGCCGRWGWSWPTT